MYRMDVTVLSSKTPTNLVIGVDDKYCSFGHALDIIKTEYITNGQLIKIIIDYCCYQCWQVEMQKLLQEETVHQPINYDLGGRKASMQVQPFTAKAESPMITEWRLEGGIVCVLCGGRKKSEIVYKSIGRAEGAHCQSCWRVRIKKM